MKTETIKKKVDSLNKIWNGDPTYTEISKYDDSIRTLIDQVKDTDYEAYKYIMKNWIICKI